ncbi:1743_t:CDS:10 [Dentiscutata erythropus]|uniref:1743_t:CDS:1 n=1 Tax=Dentiscutata erythropus TaxID=1348616 RepID=A0A9N8WKZ5_9GLOM|nr:1743_t:CDS:10 [Dentiscutata erythropus]
MSEQHNVPLSPHISSPQVLPREDSSPTIELTSTDIAETDQVIITSTKEVPILVESITEKNLLLPPLPSNQPSCDDNYPPRQLLPSDNNNNSSDVSGVKHGKGWQSQKRCTYPQEIILRVTCGPARVRRLQILSHHYKIASRLEIYIGSIQRRKEVIPTNASGSNTDEKRTFSWEKLPKIIDNDGISSDDGETEDDDYVKDDYDLIKTNGEPYIHFRRLGYCALDSNERAKYKARELKSVKLDTEGEYIRLVARSCHDNLLNQYNQVGIVAITVMGAPVDYLLAGESQKIPIEHVDEGLSRVASPEICILPVVQDDSLIGSNPNDHQNDHQNFTSLYSILPNSSSANIKDMPPVSPSSSNNFLLNAKATAGLLSAFERAKQKAVKEEDFRLAKVLKYAIELIKKSAEDVIRLDLLKKRAIGEEDFDNADKYKREIEAIKTYICNYLEEEGLELDESGEVIALDANPELADIIGLADDASENGRKPYNEYVPYIPGVPGVPGVPSGGVYQEKHHVPVGYIDVPQRQKSRSSSNSSMTRMSNSSVVHPPPTLHIPINQIDSSSSFPIDRPHHPEPVTPTTPTTPTIDPIQWEPSSVDDRPLPALSKDNHEAIPTSPLNDPNENQPEELSDLARSAFDYSIQHFGEFDVACLLSKKFPLRESALANITKRIDIDLDGKEVEGIDKVGLTKATFQIIQEALDDNPEKLTLQALNLWEVLTKFCVHHQIPTSSTWKSVDKNYSQLFGKISDSNSRIKQSAINLFILLAKTYNGPIHSMTSLVLKPAKFNNQPAKHSKAKVELVTRLVEEFGIALDPPKGKSDKDLGLNLESVMQVSVSYLNNNNGEVRDSAVKLVVEVVKRAGREKVEPFISDIKPILLENIWSLVTEYEETTGRTAGQVPSPPPSPKVVAEKEKQEIKDLVVDEELLKIPLAKRGTVTRLEQELMELKSRINNTNNFIRDDYNKYIANSSKKHQEPEEEVLELTEQELRELEELEAEEESLRKKENIENVPDNSEVPPKDKPSTKSPAKTGNKTAPAPGKQSAKRSKNDTVPPKKNLKSTPKPVSSRREPTTEEKKPPRKSSSKSTDATLCEEPEEMTPAEGSKGDRVCIFCDVYNESFTEENLVNHYWTECPILEISTLDEHMLKDCDKCKFVKQCPTCREVINADDYLAHVNRQTCLPIRDDIIRCPLCKTVIKPANEEGWKSHLLNSNGCPKNCRKANCKPDVPSTENAAPSGKKQTVKKSTEVGSKSSVASKAPSKSKVTTSSGSSKDKLKKSATKPSKIRK